MRVVVVRSVTVDSLFLLGLIDARRGNPPGGEEILGLVGQREQSTLWAHVGGAVALSCGWSVGCRESPLGDDVVNERAAPRQMAQARRSESESEADVGLAEVVRDVGAWGRYPGRVDGLRRALDRPGGFCEEPCWLRGWPGRQG